jgi:hypothetical protein
MTDAAEDFSTVSKEKDMVGQNNGPIVGLSGGAEWDGRAWTMPRWKILEVPRSGFPRQTLFFIPPLVFWRHERR